MKKRTEKHTPPAGNAPAGGGFVRSGAFRSERPFGSGLGQSRKLAAQKLRRSNQRLSSKSSNSQFLLIVRQFHFTVLCLLP